MSWQIFVTILHWNCWNGIFCFKKKIKIGGAIKNTECLEQTSAEVSTSWNLNDLIAFEFLSRIVEAKTRSHHSLEWWVVHQDSEEYGLYSCTSIKGETDLDKVITSLENIMLCVDDYEKFKKELEKNGFEYEE